MVAKPGEWRPSYNAGEFGPDFDARTDLPEYYSACRQMKNAEPIPQGGFQAMPGTIRKGAVRRQMQQVTAGRTVYAGPHVADATLEDLALAAETAISAIEIQGYTIAEDENVTLQCQVEISGSGWQDFGPALTLDNLTRNRLVALEPGSTIAILNARLRVITSASVTWSNIGTVLHVEGASLAAAVRYEDYSFSSAETYCLALTPGWCDVWRAGAWKAAFPLAGVTADMLPDLDLHTDGNTIGFFHEDLTSIRAFRSGGDEQQWNVDEWPYERIGTTDYGGNIDGSAYATTDDKWVLYLRWVIAADNIVMNVIVNGEETGGIALGVDPDTASSEWDTFAGAIQTALQGLPSLGSGVTCTQASGGTRVREFTITFGGDQSGAEYEVAGEVVNTSDASVLAAHSQIGEIEGEAYISPDRGWPAVAELVQDRIAYGGLKAKPTGTLFSANGEVFNLNTDAAGDSAAFAAAVRETVAEKIVHVLWSKYLLILTDEAEYFANNREFKATEPVNFIRASKIGSRRSVKLQEVEGLVFFVNPDGNVLYMATYDDVQTSYKSDPQSLFASHLFRQVRESAARKPAGDNDTARLYYRRDDGRLLQIMVVTSQNIIAFSEFVTDGQVLSVAVDRAGLVYLAVRRSYAGGDRINLEVMDPAEWLHGRVDYGATDLAGVLSGLDDHEGQQVWVVADGYSLGAFTVSGGEIDLGNAYTSCHVGWWQPPVVEHMPLYRIVGDGIVVRRPGRIHTAHVRIEDTTSLAVAANGEPARDVPLYRAGMAVDAPLAPQSRTMLVPGLTGYQTGTTSTITQMRPGALKVREVVMEARL